MAKLYLWKRRRMLHCTQQGQQCIKRNLAFKKKKLMGLKEVEFQDEEGGSLSLSSG